MRRNDRGKSKEKSRNESTQRGMQALVGVRWEHKEILKLVYTKRLNFIQYATE